MHHSQCKASAHRRLVVERLLVECGIRRLCFSSRLNRFEAAFGDDNHGRAEHAVFDDVPGREHLQHSASRNAGIQCFHHGLMEVRVKRLTMRINALYAMLLKHGNERPFRQIDALKQAFQSGDVRAWG